MMHSIRFDTRESGLSLVGDLPWGCHFCQFYLSKEDLLEILVPFFKAGLEGREFCVWALSGALLREDVEGAMRESVPGFDEYAQRGQMEIIPGCSWDAGSSDSSLAIVAKLDRAIAAGFDGLRISCSPGSGKARRTSICHEADVVCRYNIIAAFTYPRDELDAIGLMEVVKRHRFALVKNLGRWEVIESSEARMVKDALRRSEEKLQSLFSNMSEGFAHHRIVLDAGGRPSDYIFLEINEAFERLTGLKAENIVGRKVTEVIPGIEHDSTDWIGKYGRVALTGEPVHFESYSAPLQRWYSISAFSPHKGYFAVTFSDITQRRRYQEELERKTLHLEATNRELEAFSYSVSHDLRAPLRSIDAFGQELLEDYATGLDDNGKDCLQRIRAASERMGIIIDGLLNLSRITRSEIKRERVDLSAIAGVIAANLQTTAPERDVEFNIAGGVALEGDEKLLYLVLQNLLGNAWKFTQKRDRAKIELGVIETNGIRACYVKDNGAGFDMAYAAKLFSPFQRLHHLSEFPGTGIGLATANRIIQRHGGRIWAEGAVEKGATFYFTVE